MMTPAQLAQLAREAATHAYAPYSRYLVGAALLTEHERVFSGCNVENASYGLTNCAERTAIFKAISEGVRTFSALAIAAGDAESLPYPCGACRQVIAQFCKGDFPIYIVALQGDAEPRRYTLDDLLPHRFEL